MFNIKLQLVLSFSLFLNLLINFNSLDFNFIYGFLFFNPNLNLLLYLTVLWNSKIFFFLFFLLVIKLIFILYRVKLCLTFSFNEENLMFFILNLPLFNYFNFLYCGSFLYINLGKLNYLLTNTLNSVHPPLLYLSIALFVVFFKSSGFFFKERFRTVSFIFFGLFVSVVSITLGSWWAFQESNWGGWWNWDPSETLSLVIMLSYFILLHHKDLGFSWFAKNIHISNLLFLITILYFFIQLSFLETSHSFIDNDEYTFIYSVTFFILSAAAVFIKNKNLLFFLLKAKVCFPHLNYLLVYSCLVIVLIFYEPVINFTWFFIGLKLPVVSTSLLAIVFLLPLLVYCVLSFKKLMNITKFLQLHTSVLLVLLILLSLNLNQVLVNFLIERLSINLFLKGDLFFLDNFFITDNFFTPNLPKNHISSSSSIEEFLFFSTLDPTFSASVILFSTFFLLLFLISTLKYLCSCKNFPAVFSL